MDGGIRGPYNEGMSNNEDALINEILSHTHSDLSLQDGKVLRQSKSILLEEKRAKAALTKLETRMAKLAGELITAKSRAREAKNMADWARGLGA